MLTARILLTLSRYPFLSIISQYFTYEFFLASSTVPRMSCSSYFCYILTFDWQIRVNFKNKMLNCILRCAKESGNATRIAGEELRRWGAGRKNVCAAEKYIMTEVFNPSGHLVLEVGQSERAVSRGDKSAVLGPSPGVRRSSSWESVQYQFLVKDARSRKALNISFSMWCKPEQFLTVI